MKEDIIKMARRAGFTNPERFETDDENLRGILEDFWVNLERFAALVIANNPPQSSMAWQEGFEAGRLAEREACAKVADLVAREIDDTNGTATYIAVAIRARGQE
jgi:hypothetical protein